MVNGYRYITLVFIKPIRKDQLKDIDFDSIEVILSICEPGLLCALALW